MAKVVSELLRRFSVCVGDELGVHPELFAHVLEPTVQGVLILDGFELLENLRGEAAPTKPYAVVSSSRSRVMRISVTAVLVEAEVFVSTGASY